MGNNGKLVKENKDKERMRERCVSQKSVNARLPLSMSEKL